MTAPQSGRLYIPALQAKTPVLFLAAVKIISRELYADDSPRLQPLGQEAISIKMLAGIETDTVGFHQFLQLAAIERIESFGGPADVLTPNKDLRDRR